MGLFDNEGCDLLSIFRSLGGHKQLRLWNVQVFQGCDLLSIFRSLGGHKQLWVRKDAIYCVVICFQFFVA